MYTEHLLDYPDGTKVLCRSNIIPHAPQVVFLHGIGETLDLYNYMFPYFDEARLSCAMLELRGHGTTESQSIYIRDLSESLVDLKRMVFGLLENRPVYLVGCGVAGYLVSRLVDDVRFKVKGIALVSPPDWNKVSTIEKCMIYAGTLFFKRHSFSSQTIQLESLCEDADAQLFAKDECKKTMQKLPFKTLFAILKEEKRFRTVLPFLAEIPLFSLFGSNDQLTDENFVKSLLQTRATAGRGYQQVKGASHYLLLEKGRVDSLTKIISWIHETERLHNSKEI